MKRLTATLILSLALGAVLTAQEVLDTYIQQALRSNIALRRQELSYEKSLAALREAKNLFFPKLDLNARFSVARGGRTIDIPVGDLVNPVYENLNLINQINAATIPDYPTLPTYPFIENEQEFFLRPTEQETFVRLSTPVFNADILYNHRIRGHLAEAERVGVAAYRRELVMEVKTGYYNYLKAREGVVLYERSLELVQENLRTAESLFKYHKITQDAVFSAGAQVQQVEAQLAEARKNARVAQAYFNYLLNRPYDDPIEAVDPNPSPLALTGLEAAREQAWQQREEFEQLDHYLSAREDDIRRNKANYLPELNLALDYGIQGLTYDLSDPNADYFLGSAVMRWNLFDPANKSRTQQVRIEKEQIVQQEREARQQIGLQVVEAWYEVEAAREQVDNAQAGFEAAREAFRIIRRKYEQGQANQVEYTEARTRLTNAGQQLIITRYDYQVQLAELERATASYPIR